MDGGAQGRASGSPKRVVKGPGGCGSDSAARECTLIFLAGPGRGGQTQWVWIAQTVSPMGDGREGCVLRGRVCQLPAAAVAVAPYRTVGCEERFTLAGGGFGKLSC